MKEKMEMKELKGRKWTGGYCSVDPGKRHIPVEIILAQNLLPYPRSRARGSQTKELLEANPADSRFDFARLFHPSSDPWTPYLVLTHPTMKHPKQDL